MKSIILFGLFNSQTVTVRVKFKSTHNELVFNKSNLDYFQQFSTLKEVAHCMQNLEYCEPIFPKLKKCKLGISSMGKI